MIDDSLTPYSDQREQNKCYKTLEQPTDPAQLSSNINMDSHQISKISKIAQDHKYTHLDSNRIRDRINSGAHIIACDETIPSVIREVLEKANPGQKKHYVDYNSN
jgi:hypothetical protein